MFRRIQNYLPVSSGMQGFRERTNIFRTQITSQQVEHLETANSQSIFKLYHILYPFGFSFQNESVKPSNFITAMAVIVQVQLGLSNNSLKRADSLASCYYRRNSILAGQLSWSHLLTISLGLLGNFMVKVDVTLVRISSWDTSEIIQFQGNRRIEGCGNRSFFELRPSLEEKCGQKQIYTS